MPGTRLGSGCTVFPNAVLGAVPQDLKFAGEYTTATIGNNTIIRECVTINRGTANKQTTAIGDNCLLMAYSHVAHDCILGNNVVLANAVNLAGHVTIGDYAILGGMSAVHQFASIGAHAMVSGGSLVRKDVPPFITCAHEPLAYVGVNSVGLRRRGFDNDIIFEIQEMCRILFNSEMNYTQATAHIQAHFADTPVRNTMLNFMKNATRGVIKGYQKLSHD
jgi:UDP-N-acetylglucosamine acyltransferase